MGPKSILFLSSIKPNDRIVVWSTRIDASDSFQNILESRRSMTLQCQWRNQLASLSPAISAIAQRAPEQCGYGGTDGGYAWVDNPTGTLGSSHQGYLVTAVAECHICQWQRPTLSRRYDAALQVTISDLVTGWLY